MSLNDICHKFTECSQEKPNHYNVIQGYTSRRGLVPCQASAAMRSFSMLWQSVLLRLSICQSCLCRISGKAPALSIFPPPAAGWASHRLWSTPEHRFQSRFPGFPRRGPTLTWVFTKRNDRVPCGGRIPGHFLLFSVNRLHFLLPCC